MINIISQRLMKHTLKLILKGFHFSNFKQEKTEYYFAYGANLNSKRFSDHSIPYEEIGTSFVFDHKISFSLPCEYKLKGYANVSFEKNKKVWGKLFKISKPGLFLLDILEWVPFKFYRREELTVLTSEGDNIKSWVYKVIDPDFKRIPPTNYLNLIINKSIEASFPKDYIDELKRFESREFFELDPGFRLSNPSQRRYFEKKLKKVYLIHDRFREMVSKII